MIASFIIIILLHNSKKHILIINKKQMAVLFLLAQRKVVQFTKGLSIIQKETEKNLCIQPVAYQILIKKL